MADYGALNGEGTLVFERLLPGPIERVWDYIVKPELREAWFCGGKTDDHAGGTMTLAFDHRKLSESGPPEKYADQETGSFDCDILVYEPPHRLDITWPAEQGHPPTEVSIMLSEADGKVRLVLQHKRLTDGDFLIGAAAGWHAHFDLLQDNLDGRAVRDFWPRHMALEAAYETRLKKTG
ncbi:SRPBCC family protein [Henriciella sp. AS95]|uniref:SRPBCC family protein n=1 Tax=Henriciella sp. AS95 TaxID=3135782 RepID=UPI003174C596